MRKEFERITPEQAGISSKDVLKFIEKFKENGNEMHSIMLLRHGKIFAETWYKPYNKDSKHIMFSFTKSLTSTAVGFARQEGLMDIDEKLVDIFPDKLPENPSENLKKCRVRDLLTMSCGHEDEIPLLGMGDKDWIASFLNHPFKYEPGTHYLYNTAGTNLVSAILKIKTGVSLMEYLKPRLFDKLGMDDIPCYTLPDGTDMGGAGSRMTTEDMARFIQFVANRGTWDGERLLEESWFDLACTPQVDCSPASDLIDWKQGYGFQYWMCVPKGVFRADGAFGQFGIVCPKEDVVVIITSSSSNTYDVLTTVWEELLPCFHDDPLPEDKESLSILKYVLDHNEITPVYGTRSLTGNEKFDGNVYIPAEPITGNWADFIGGSGISSKGGFEGVIPANSSENFESLKVIPQKNSLNFVGTFSGREEILPVSLTGHFNEFILSGKTFGACGGWRTNSIFEFAVYCAEAATGKRYYVDFGKNDITFTFFSSLTDFGGLNDEEGLPVKFVKK